jgi:hypothetical protein
VRLSKRSLISGRLWIDSVTSARRESRPLRSYPASRKPPLQRCARHVAEHGTTWCCPSGRRGRCAVLAASAGWRMRRSVVSSTSNPAVSAAVKSAPLLSVSQPLDCAVWTVCPDNARTSPFGVPWSKRMSTGGDVGSAQALSTNARTVASCSRLTSNCSMTSSMLRSSRFSMTRGHGQTGALEHPRAPDLAGDALHSGALGPIERCHGLTSKLQLTGSRVGRHAGSPRAPEPLDLPQPDRHLVPTGENLALPADRSFTRRSGLPHSPRTRPLR